MRPRLIRVRVAHDVAVDVAAGRDRVHQRAVDRLHGPLQVALDHAVQLERLAGGEPERAVAEVVGDPVHRQPLRGRADAARHAHPDHEGVGLLELLPAPLGPQVAIVLQVGAMELGELGVVLTDRAGHRLGKASLDRAAQMAARLLDVLVPAARGGHASHSLAA